MGLAVVLVVRTVEHDFRARYLDMVAICNLALTVTRDWFQIGAAPAPMHEQAIAATIAFVGRQPTFTTNLGL
jgi:hypothetical protein